MDTKKRENIVLTHRSVSSMTSFLSDEIKKMSNSR